MSSPPKPQVSLHDSQGQALSAEEIAWRQEYLAALTPEAIAAMKRPAKGDVEARLRAHIERLEAEAEQAQSA